LSDTDSSAGVDSGAVAPVVGDPVAPGSITGATAADSTASPDSSNDGDEVNYDFAGLRSELAALSAVAATQADIENLRRQAGHIPGVMSRLDKIEKSVTQNPTDPRVDTLIERFNALLEGTDGLIPAETVSKLKVTPPALTKEDVDRSVQERLAELAAQEDQKKTPEIDPELLKSAQVADAQWASVAVAVQNFAKAQGIDPATIPAQKYQEAQFKTFNAQNKFGDPVAAAEELMAYVKTLKATKDRKGERADAASGGLPNDRGAAQGGTISLTEMEKMTAEQLMKIPRDVRDAALRAGI
jgi:hypothetical protein